MILLFVLHFFVLQSQPVLSVNLENVLPNQSIRLGIYDSAKGFPNPEGVKFYREFKAGNTKSTVLTLADLPEGTYAIAVYQDLNNNKKLDVNLFGYPTEPFGFSNNIRPKFKAPSFEVCKFEYRGSKNNIKIKLIN
jgi:uncharacterized protein (DUF2141 family)